MPGFISPEKEYFVNVALLLLTQSWVRHLSLSLPHFLIPAAGKRNSREVLVETLLSTPDPAMSPPGTPHIWVKLIAAPWLGKAGTGRSS